MEKIYAILKLFSALKTVITSVVMSRSIFDFGSEQNQT